MQIIFLAFFVGFASAGYHRNVGVPTAERIRQAEASRDIGGRITSGSYAQLGSYSYFGGLIIALNNSSLVSICGSTLISDTKLVTAGHCWSDGEEQAVMMEVVLASTTLFTGGTRILTNQITVHEAFNPLIVSNDIAIITVPPVTFDAYISPINLPEDSRSFVDVPVQVIGFGMTDDTNPIEASQQLSYVDVTVRSDETCLIYGFIYTSSMICTETVTGGPCRGDSGGPLVYRNESGDILIGLVSYGSDEGCTLGYPTVYTRITSYIDWINSNI